MKLQITGVQAKAIAAQLGERHPTLNEDALRVLDVMRAEGLNPLTRKDVTAILNEMGWETTSQHAWADIGMAIESRCEKTNERGFYTQAGVTPKVVTTPTGEEVTVVRRAGVAWKPEAVIADDAEGLYADDASLRRMAVSDSPCFGRAHSSEAPACKVCPLARFCAKASVAVMADIAKLLDLETERAYVKAKTPEPVPVVEPDPVPTPEPTPQPEPTTPHDGTAEGITAALTARYGAGVAKEIKLPFAGICTDCDEGIEMEVVAAHIPGKGILHIACALK